MFVVYLQSNKKSMYWSKFTKVIAITLLYIVIEIALYMLLPISIFWKNLITCGLSTIYYVCVLCYDKK